MLRLSIRSAGQPPAVYEVRKVRTTIGRSARSDICLDDLFASRIHAELRSEGDTYWVTDLGSANGTLVGDEALDGTRQVFPGDRIRIGETVIELVTVSDPASSDSISRVDLTTAGLVSAEHTVGDLAAVTTASGLDNILQSVEVATGEMAEGPAGRRRDLFGVVSQVAVALLSQSSLDQVLSRVLDLVFEAIPAHRALLFLRDPSGQLRCHAARSRAPDAPGPKRRAEDGVAISQLIEAKVIEQGQAILTSDAQTDERFRGRDSIILGNIRSVMAVPMSLGGNVLGMIYVDSPAAVNVFGRDDLRLLTTIASVSAIKVQNALLLQHQLETERIRQQLASARDIQSRLLPTRPPELAGYDLLGISFPSFAVGGDYFDFVERDGGGLLVGLGDVSGKGMDAAMLMSSLHAAVRAQGAAGLPVPEIARRINRYLHASIPPNRFVTLFLGNLDPAGHRLTFSNAGHNPPLLVRRTGEVERLASSGLPVGIDPAADWREDSVDLAAGEVLVLYSDGIVEATDSEDQEYGLGRLAEVASAYRGAGAAELRDRIDESVQDFLGSRQPADDMTLVIVKRVD